MKLLEFLYEVLGCLYMSDLHFEPYKTRALMILDQLDIGNYSLDDIVYAKKYIRYLE